MRALAVLIVTLMATAAPAAAQVAVEEAQMTVPGNRFLIQAFVEINLSKDVAFEPVSIAPDLWFGLTDAFTLGVVHSGRAATGLFGSVGDSLCVTGEDHGCPKVYDALGLDARYHFLRRGGLTLSGDGGLFARSLDPFTLALKLGVVVHWQRGPLVLETGPNLWLGLTERTPDVGSEAGPNKEVLYLPVNLMFELVPRLSVAAQLGLALPFNDTGDTFLFGVTLGVQARLLRHWIVDLAFSLPALAGGDLVNTGGDLRTLTVGVAYAY